MARTRPEYTKRTLGAKAPTFRLKLSDFSKPVTQCEYSAGSFGWRCGAPTGGQRFCEKHGGGK